VLLFRERKKERERERARMDRGIEGGRGGQGERDRGR